MFVPSLVISCNAVLFSEEKGGERGSGGGEVGGRPAPGAGGRGRGGRGGHEQSEEAVVGLYYMKEECVKRRGGKIHGGEMRKNSQKWEDIQGRGCCISFSYLY